MWKKMAVLSLSVMISSCSEQKIDLNIEFVSIKNFDKEKIIGADFSGDELISINLISKYSIRNYINSHKINPYVEVSYCKRYDFDEEGKIRSVSSIFDKNGRVEYGFYSDDFEEGYKYTILVYKKSDEIGRLRLSNGEFDAIDYNIEHEILPLCVRISGFNMIGLGFRSNVVIIESNVLNELKKKLKLGAFVFDYRNFGDAIFS